MESKPTGFAHALSKLLKDVPTLDSVANEASDLHYAATTGDEGLLLKCLNEDNSLKDINNVDDNGKTALFMAVMKDHKQIVNILLKHGALQHVMADTGDFYSSALHAVRNSDMVLTLTAAGGNVNIVNERGETPLHRAIPQEIEDVVQTLIRQGANVKIKDNQGLTPLHTACDSPCSDSILNIIKSLTNAGACINATDNFGRTPLHFLSCSIEPMKGVSFLLNHGAKLNLRDYHANFPVHDCIDNIHVQEKEYIGELLELYFPSAEAVNLVNAKGKTALHLLVVDVDVDIFEQVILLGADVNKRDNAGKSPMYYVTDRKDNNDVVGVLLRHGASINMEDDWGRTPLMNLADQEQKICFQPFIANHADVNHADKCGITALHVACYKDSPYLVEQLIENGANVNATDANGSSPLHAAAFSGSINAVKMLVKCEAEFLKTDKNSKSAKDIAVTKGYDEIRDILSPKNDLNDERKSSSNVKFSSVADELLDLQTVQKMLKENSFKRTKENVKEYVSDILQTPHTGRGADDAEAKEIQLVVENTIQILARKIGEEDPRFRCIVLHAGSFSEGTKTKCPDEFDFMLCLEEFSKYCKPEFQDDDTKMDTWVGVPPVPKRDSNFTTTDEMFEDIEPEEIPVSISDYVYISLERTSEAKPYIDFIGGYEMPNHKMYEGFTKLVERVLFSKDFPKDRRLVPIEVTVEPALKFLWRGTRYKYMEIDVDLVPALLLSNWPDKTRKDCKLLTDDLLRLPCLAVPKMTSQHDWDLWRCSLALVETAIFRKLRPEIINSYIACKSFVSSSILPHITFGEYDEEMAVYKELHGSISDDEDITFHESAESIIPSYVIKMTFLSLLEERIAKSGIESVFNMEKPSKEPLPVRETKAEPTGMESAMKSKSKCDVSKAEGDEDGENSTSTVTNSFKSNPQAMSDSLQEGDQEDIQITKTAQTFYGPSVYMNSVERSLEFDMDLVRDVFLKCEENIEKKFVPSVFNHRHNVLGGRILSEDSDKVLLFFNIINALIANQ